MTLEWFGEGCFKITETGNRFSILTETPSKDSGLPIPRHKTDVYLSVFSNLSDSLFNSNKKENEIFIINNAGDYELKDNFIRGMVVSVKEGLVKSIYTIKMEDIRVAYLGMINNKEWTPEAGNFLGEIDIMLIPIGGGEMLDAVQAVEVIKQVEPKIVIPMYYKIPGLKIKRGELNTFLNKMEIKKIEEMDKLLIKSRELENWGEEIKVYILKQS
ncbi:MAG: MBL fold metallo-hydrolase [Patescibacteria group bacterium]|jgi:L-ascorbate metabolism protein UlaG (beta-lactamase superfamily)|nr:MBL fold metallo-hydrolase [Patescibacteria group bacterium]